MTYLGHSGFLMEWGTCYWLFDYYVGDLPPLDAGKKVFVFVSHGHGDHFNPKVFDLRDKHPNVEFVMSSDIERAKVDVSPEQVVWVDPEKQYELYDDDHNAIRLTTLRSTDLGVAFLLDYLGKTVYHAGDLNLWVWKEETEQYNQEMTAAFDKQMKSLTGTVIDIAFVPLDPRQEEDYYMGMENFLATAKVKCVFPMHFGKEFSVIVRYKKERATNLRGTTIMDIERAGQEWDLES